MKKIIGALLIGLTLMFCLTGCNNTEKLIGEESTVKAENDEVLLKLREETLTKTGATFVLENNMKRAIDYTPAYEIEMKKDDVWYKLNVVNEFADEIYEVDPKSTDQIIIDWKQSYSKLSKGEYRVVKEISVPETLELFYVVGEFTIE